MEIAGYSASVFIGISLGLIGGGGSILTVPVLVYLFHLDTALATAYSLFVVGSTSAVGSFSYFRKGLVQVRTAIVFGIPSIVTIFIARAFILPAIPQLIFSIGSFSVTKDMMLMLVFAVLMVAASNSMVRKDYLGDSEVGNAQTSNLFHIIWHGVLIGTTTGLIGAGGGFMIIPALVSLLKLPMKVAVGTSLVIVAINSLMGFLFSLSHITVQWGFLAAIASMAIVGVWIGSYLSTKISTRRLKPAFGWFMLLMGIYIILSEIL